MGEHSPQSQLRDSERRFRAIFDESYQLIFLLEPDGTLSEPNATALSFAGLRSEEVVGRKIWETPWWRDFEESRDALRASVARAAAGEFVHYESELQGQDGATFFIDFSLKPIRNRTGDITMLIAEGRNITELRRALQSLRLTEFRLEEAQRIAHLGHWEYNMATEQTAWSSTLYDIFGIDPEAHPDPAAAFAACIRPEDATALREGLERSFKTGRPYEYNFRITRPDGLVRTIYAAGGPVTDESGQTVRMAGILQDVTGRHQLELSLAQMVERLTGLNTMGQAVTSSLDMEFIYQRVLSTARQLLSATAVFVLLHERDELYIVASEQEEDLRLLGVRIKDDDGIPGAAWKSGRPMWWSGEELRRRRSRKLAESSGLNAGTAIAVPIRYQEEQIGILEAANNDEDGFTLDDVRMLQAVASWTAIAIGKVRQHQSLERRVQESEAVASISRALTETLEPHAILEMVVNTAHDIVPRSDWSVMHLLHGRPERLDPVAVAGTDTDLSDYIIGHEEGIAGLALKLGRTINVADIQHDSRASNYAHSIGLRSLLVAPIQSRNRRLGTISLHCRQPGAFTEEDERLLTILASQVGLGIENANLFDSQRRARLVAELQRERLRVLTDRLVTTQEEERLRISRELHDEAGQALTSLKINLDLLRAGLPAEQENLRARLADLATLTGETMDTLRTLAHDLRPPGLDAFGLNVALEGLCHDYSTRTGLTAAYDGVELPGLPTAVALSLYRFVQEALTNIAKHAQARNVSVQLRQDDGELVLSVADDGNGFTYDPNTSQGGVGLVSMHERADLLGGTLDIDTAPGRGARLTIRVPTEVYVAGEGPITEVPVTLGRLAVEGGRLG